MNNLKPKKCSLDGLKETNDVERAQIAINNSFALGCGDVVGPKDIVKGNNKVNTIFVAELFKNRNGMPEDKDEKKSDNDVKSSSSEEEKEENKDGDVKPKVDGKKL